MTGIEVTAEIAEQYPQLRVRLISRGAIADSLSGAGRHAVRKRLSALGVEIVENTDVQWCDDSSIRTSGGDTLRSDCTIWTAGFSAPVLARDSGLPTDALGRLMVDESLSCPQYPDIFGAGDAIQAPQTVAGHLRMSCATALPLGAHAADSIIARLENRAPAPLSAGYMLRCISLGRKSGLVQTVRADDRPRGLVVRGRLAAMAKVQICQMTLSWIRGELRRNGSYSWPKGPRRQKPGKAVGTAGVFEEHRSLLFTIAYEITGTATDAEDVVQDSFLRWSAVDAEAVQNPRAYLAKTVTRQALNSLRAAQRRREDYIGPWLPEPVVTAPDVADNAVLSESLSFAMLVVLETLSPDERAVFVLREVFDFPYAEIAEATDKSAGGSPSDSQPGESARARAAAAL